MRAAEFLRGIADMLSAIEDDKQQQAPAPVIVNVNGGSSSTPEINPKQEKELDDDPTMVPPLQQKLELMKKMAGMPNKLDNKAKTIVADDDEPFDG